MLGVARPASAVPQPPPASASLSKRERAAAIRQRAGIARIRQELHSLWCDSLYKFSLANHYRYSLFKFKVHFFMIYNAIYIFISLFHM